MTPEQFAYWLQGFAELNPQAPNAEQWQAIRDHLNLVFKKETPVRVIGPNIASPALPEDPLRDAVRRFNERQSPRYWPDGPNFPGAPVITC